MSLFLKLHPDDDVVVARQAADAGTPFGSNGVRIDSAEPIPFGHKMAIRAIAAGEPVRKYGQIIGQATLAIEPGEWVHGHNLGAGEFVREHEFCTAVPAPPKAEASRTFDGYRRADGRAGTRNYIAIVSTVNCSATASKWIADAFDSRILADYPNVDGIVALTHKGGCAIEYGGSDHQQLARTMAGFARHPNVGAYLVVGLGCETSQPSYLTSHHDLVQLEGATSDAKPLPLVMNIQEEGGVRRTVQRGVDVLKSMLPLVNDMQRVPIPASELTLATECGGSDGSSGITANPAVGIASDLLVACGGTSILAETPEIYGGEQLLTRRAVTPEVAEQLLDRIRWWQDYARRHDARIDNNPSVGNKQGGLTTIYEKSLGAIAKGGSTALRAVYRYAEPVTEKGFVVMDTPGYDPPSVTGMVAGGAQVVVFTTGRGSCFGCKPAPTIKVATNTPMFERMRDDMDIDAGGIWEGRTVEDVGREIFEEVLAVASGKRTRSEAQGIGDEEFCPWTPGPIF